MAEIRQVTIKVRDRQINGGLLPADAVFGEPFVNLYNGALRFSGITGGDFVDSGQPGVFEVGSKLYNSNISNRLNINDNFIISGDTGLISTYGGTSGAGLAGKFMSGTTDGFVLGNISDIQGVTTRVQPGINTYTGGTADNPTVNVVDSPSFNDITFSGTATGGNALFADMSATTLYSGSTDVDTIIRDIAAEVSGVHTYIQNGTNTFTGGTDLLPTVNIVDSPNFDNITFSGTATGGDIVANDIITNTLSAITSLSAETMYSGGTSLETIIENIAADAAGEHTYVQGGTNIVTGGTPSLPTISLVDSPFVDVLNASGHVFTNGTTYSGGTIQDDGVFTIDAATQVEVDSDLLPTAHLTYDLGAVGQRWNRLFARRIRLGTSSTILEDNLFSSTTGDFQFDFAGDLFIDNNTYPEVGVTYDMGRAANRWKTGYFQDVDMLGDLSATALTVSNLTQGRVVYAGVGGLLTDEAGFEYDETSNTFKAGKIQIGNPGDTGTTTTVFGDILVIGQSISGFTSELYIEDNLIELNYNPSASTTSTSLGAGWAIQDGSGVASTDVLWDIRGTATGLDSRSFTTNLQDIRVRETGTISNPNGLRLIAETDCIDGGSY